MQYLEKEEGSIFFIPLFLDNSMKENNKSYSNYKFNDQENYAFGRLIEINKSTGDLIEIFNYTGKIPENNHTILESGLLLDPIYIAMAFGKKRWRFIFKNDQYNKEVDSNYNNITFLLGDRDLPIFWKGGKKTKITKEDSLKYKRWVVHHPTRIEEAIRSKDLSLII